LAGVQLPSGKLKVKLAGTSLPSNYFVSQNKLNPNNFKGLNFIFRRCIFDLFV